MRAARLPIFSAIFLIAVCGSAQASQLIGRNASHPRLSVARNGMATLSYRARGREWHVLAWGAKNARAPTRARPQVKFRLDYSGGWSTFHREAWRAPNACSAYRGPKLVWLVSACTAPDGSYWAVQSWQRLIPMGGARGDGELRLSHWTGSLASLKIRVDARPRNDVLYGQFTYRDRPIHGFRATRTGAPPDTYRRNIYLDARESAYGSGWRRVNGFLARRPEGIFCYVLAPTRGKGVAYRAAAIGPGVTPDVFWSGMSAPVAAGLTGALVDASRLCG